jgi:hypothetical protein
MTEHRDVIARVRNGEGKPRGIRFARGVASGPFSLGKRGAWQISADGVEDVHAYMQFDGDQVSVLGLAPANPPTLDGSPVGEKWTVVSSPGVVHIGNLSIVVDTIEEDDHLFEPAPSGQPTVPGKGRATISEREVATVLAPHPHPLAKVQWSNVAPLPLTESPHLEMPTPAVRPNGKTNGALVNGTHVPDAAADDFDIDLSDDSDQPHERVIGKPGEVPTRVVDIKAMYPQGRALPNGVSKVGSILPSAVEPTAKPVRRGLGGSFRAASLPKRIVFILLPLTFAAFIYRTAALQAARSRAQAAHVGAPATSAQTSAKTKIAEEGTTSLGATGPRIAPAASDAPAAAQAPEPEGPRQGAVARTRERQAADLVSSGDYAGAVKVYQELSAAHPDLATFREAARILQEKSAQGAQDARRPEKK